MCIRDRAERRRHRVAVRTDVPARRRGDAGRPAGGGRYSDPDENPGPVPRAAQASPARPTTAGVVPRLLGVLVCAPAKRRAAYRQKYRGRRHRRGEIPAGGEASRHFYVRDARRAARGKISGCRDCVLTGGFVVPANGGATKHTLSLTFAGLAQWERTHNFTTFADIRNHPFADRVFLHVQNLAKRLSYIAFISYAVFVHY